MHAGVKSPVFQKYKVSGGGYKKNVRCPHCHSGTRSRLLGLYFHHRAEVLKSDQKVLHISPNRQLAHKLKNELPCHYHVGAINPKHFLPFSPIELDVRNMPFQDDSYDVIICNHVLEHIKDDKNAMREIHRVLKPGGYGILQVPLALDLDNTIEEETTLSRKQRKLHFGQEDHLRLYGRDYFVRLESVGFSVQLDHPLQDNWVDEDILTKHKLDALESVVIARKLEKK